MKKILLTLMLGIILLSCVSAEQVLWDDDSDIEVYDAWKDIDGTPLTGATCSWYVYDLDGTLNQNGDALEFSVGIFNFSVSSLAIGIYPLGINCSKGSYNGTSTKDSIKIVDELSEEYKIRLEEINQTTHDTYNLLVDEMNVTLTNIFNLTNLTYNNLLTLETNITNLDIKLTSLRNYLEDKWGVENAEDIMEKIKDIRSDVTYLRSRYYAITEAEKRSLLLSIRSDSQEVLSLLYGKDKWWEKALIWLVPIGLIIFIILGISLIIRAVRKKKKPKTEEFGGDMHGNG